MGFKLEECIICVCTELTFLVILKGFSVKVSAGQVRLIFLEAS